MKMGFLNQMNIFSSAYDVLLRQYDEYDVIVNFFHQKRGVIYPRVVLCAKYRVLLR